MFVLFVLGFGRTQCSDIYFYRFNSLLQSELPVFLTYDGQQVAAVRPGGRYKVSVCSAGTYSFSAKMNMGNSSLSNVTINVQSGKDYYVKMGAAVGLGIASITKVDNSKGKKDINKGRKFVGGIRDAQINSSGGSSFSTGTGTGIPPVGSGTFQRTQVVDNFKFDIVDIVKAGDRLELKYLITNMAGDDRMLYAHGTDVYFYDNLGTILSANEICIAKKCDTWATIMDVSSYNKRGESCASRYTNLGVTIPYGIPIKARMVINGLKNDADRFVRGQMMFYVATKDGKNGHDIKLVYYDLKYPSVIDASNPNKRNFGALSLELLDAKRNGNQTTLHYTFTNNAREEYLLNLTKQSVFYDNMGNQYETDGMAFVTPTNRVQTNYYKGWNKKVLGGQRIDFYVFIKDIPNSATQLSRVTLDFDGFNLSWNNISISGNGFSPQGSSTGTTSPSSNQDYLTYNDLEGKVGRQESVVGKKVVLENIYFTSGSDDILPASFAQLNKLVNLLKSNNYLKVEISGHTDNVGDDMTNMLLSQKRADAIKYYLIGKSINPSRISSVGKGKDEPIRENSTTEGKKANRRVEIRIAGN